jgi:hypothetical protein
MLLIQLLRLLPFEAEQECYIAALLLQLLQPLLLLLQLNGPNGGRLVCCGCRCRRRRRVNLLLLPRGL